MKKSPVLKYLKLFQLIYLFFLSIFLITNTSAQVSIAPTALHLSHRNMSDRLIVYNNSRTEEVEIVLDVRYGYPASNENGVVSIHYPEIIGPAEPNATEWVHFFPRRFSLAPGESQTVRIAVRPPARLPGGEYWARAVIKSIPIDRKDDTDELESDALRVGIRIQLNTVIALNYRHGDVHTGVKITNLNGVVDEDFLSIRVESTRLGNAAFLGNLIIKIRDSENRIIEEFQREIAVYNDLTRIFKINRNKLNAGIYTIEVELNTDRKMDGGYILPAAPVRKSVRVNVP